MAKILTEVFHHIKDNRWLFTSGGEPRGYIQPRILTELWFNTGTVCNLSCPFCFEGSNPHSSRLEQITLEDIKPLIDEADALGVRQFSFTGGEPFMNSAMIDILSYALDHNPCLVLTNGTLPLSKKLSEVAQLRGKRHSLSFRVSIDFPDEKLHDANRGEGNFRFSLKLMSELHRLGFKVSVARKQQTGENKQAADSRYLPFLKEAGLPENTPIVSFAELLPPVSEPDVPQITESCMTTYKTEEEREQFMCSYSKMVIKKDGGMKVYACTLVDDDPGYSLAENLKDAMDVRVMLRHHRCYSCFAAGTSCSESSC